MARDPSTPLRRPDPHDAKIDADTSSNRTDQATEVASPGSAVDGVQSSFGNQVTLGALAGESIGGIGPLVSGELTFSAGSAVTEGPVASNAAMQRRLRRSTAEAEGIDMGAADALIRHSGGSPLPSQALSSMEAAFGHDFGHVRVHTDAAAHQAAALLHAHAFALGADVYFGSGEFAPGTPAGDRVLAHELTHVVQHDEGRLPTGPGDVSSPADSHEREAYGNEDRILGAISHGPVAEASPADAAGMEVSAVPEASAAGSAEAVPSSALEVAAPESGGEEISRSSVPGQVASNLGFEERAHLWVQPSADRQSDVELELAVAMGLLTRDEASELLGEPEAEEIAAELHRKGVVTDVDPARAATTSSLLARLSRQLGLSPTAVAVQVDEAAAAHLQALGTRGLWESGTIFLDPESYDPTTADGRGLLAHEMAHAAQASLAEPGAVDGVLAEAEATMVGRAFSAGEAVETVSVGMPATHSAQEGGGLTAGLQGLLDSFRSNTETARAEVDGQSEGMPQGESEELSDPEQDREAKMDRFEDGVDGIADKIGDLSAFDDLCDAEGENDNAARRDALNRIKSTEDFDKLSGMWAGALAGEEDSSQMQSIFNSEFDERGFWSETERAFDLVEAAAKAEGRQKYAEKQAEAQRAREAQERGEEERENGEEAADEAGEAAAEGGGPGGDVPSLEASLQELGEMPVPEEALPTPTFEAAQARMEDGGVWSQVVTEFEHYNENVGAVQEAAGGGVTDRAGQVFGELFSGLAGGLGKGFVSQGLDSLVLDTIGSLGDYAIFAASKGSFRAPFIGPAISLAQALYDPAAFLEGIGQNATDAWTDIGEGAANFGRAWDAGLSWDAVGFVFAGIAEFLSAIGNLLTMITTILGVLSAVCYVVGGILIAVGLALSWLGIGAALLPIGGWFINAGTVLGNIVNVLGPITLIVKAAAMLYRTLGALLVPADAYAEQLGALGQDAERFGEAAGAKVADQTAGRLRDQAADAINPRDQRSTNAGDADAEAGGTGGRNRADEDMAEVDTRVQEAETARDQVADAQARREQQQNDPDPAQQSTRPQDGDADAAQQPTRPRDQGDADGDAPAQRRNIEDVPVAGALVGGIRDLGRAMTNIDGHVNTIGDIGRNLRRLVANPSEAAQMGMQSAIGPRGLERISTRQQELSDETTTRNQEIDTALRGLDDEIAPLRSEAEQLRARRQQMEDSDAPFSLQDRMQLMGINRRLQQLDGQLRGLDRDVTTLQNERQTNQDFIDNLANNRQIVDDARNDPGLERARDRDNDPAEDRQHLRDLDTNQRRVEELQRQRAERDDQITAKQEEMAQVQRDLDDIDSQRRSSQDDQELQDQLDSSRSFNESDRARLEREIQDLQRQNDTDGEEIDGLRPSIDRGQSLREQGLSADDDRLVRAQHQRYMDETLQHDFDRARDGDGQGDQGAARRILGSALRTAGSGNATGGVGSAYKDLMDSNLLQDALQGIANIGSGEEQVDQGSNQNQSNDATAEAFVASDGNPNAWGAGSSDDYLTGNQQQNETDQPWYQDMQSAWSGAGQSAANGIYSLVGGPFHNIANAPAPPAEDMESMEERFRNAEEASDAAMAAWSSAFKAYQAQLVAEDFVAAEEALRETDGAELEGAVETVRPVGPELRAREEERQGRAESEQTEAGEPDEEQSGLVGLIVPKLAGDGGDYVDDMDSDQAEGAGSAATDGQGAANEGGEAAKQAASDASTQNIDLITAGDETLVAEETFIADANAALEEKTAQDQASVEEIKASKAGYMQEALQQQATAESEASAFNGELDTWSSWAATYRSMRGGR